MLFRKIVQYCPKWFKNLTFTSKKCSARLVRFLHFLFWLKVCFLRLQPACKENSIFLLPHTIFSHFWKNVVSKDQKCEKIVWWSKEIELSLQAGWSRKKHAFSQNKKCKNLTKRPDHFFLHQNTILIFSESVILNQAFGVNIWALNNKIKLAPKLSHKVNMRWEGQKHWLLSF